MRNNTVSPARIAAFEALVAIATENAASAAVLANQRFDSLARDDHRLLQELTLGVLRRQSWLDFLITRYGQRPVASLDPEVIFALRLGLYQLRFLSRVPPHAAINESVNLVKHFRKRSAAPFVNAILRASQREGEPPDSCLPADPVRRLSLVTSHPTWLLNNWIKLWGLEEATALATHNNLTPRQVFRHNPLVVARERLDQWLTENNIVTCPGRFVPEAQIVEQGSITPNSLPVREGWIYLQEESSQLVARLAAWPTSGNARRSLWDVCAAPGGKISLIAQLRPQNSLNVATDNSWSRLLTMKSLLRRQRLDGIHTALIDLRSGVPFISQPFDDILVDAPCSGLGTIRKNPEIKWRVTPDEVKAHGENQLAILNKVADALSPGGTLTYSVCSTEKIEGEGVIERFLTTHPEFEDGTFQRLEQIGVAPALLASTTRGVQMLPHRHGSEGFFICTLLKRRTDRQA